MHVFAHPHQTDAAVVRGVALVVVITALVGALTGLTAIPAALALDFLIRGFLNPRLSPLAAISRRIVVPLSTLESRPMYFPPKRFAARVGLIFSLAATVLFATGATMAGSIVLLVLSVFAGLECFLNLCVGCLVYNAFTSFRHRMKGPRYGRSIR